MLIDKDTFVGEQKAVIDIERSKDARTCLALHIETHPTLRAPLSS